MLEASQHPFNSFWTLTYSDDTIPLTIDGLQTLRRKDLTDFVKRLREDYSPLKLRYFNVGEYGDSSERPHYHLALFNYPSCSRGHSQFNRRANCCSVCERVLRIWGKGIVHSGQLEDNSAAYIAGYVTKKLTSAQDPRLKGREKEFGSMSLKPGIGAGFMDEVASTLLEHQLDRVINDVPNQLAHSGRPRPLGRYLTRRLRERIGMAPEPAQATLRENQERLQPMRDLARQISPLKGYTETLKNVIIDAHEGRFNRLVARQQFTKKRGTI